MTGEHLYDMYREERIGQGWQEFLWKSMSKPQQLVWDKLAARIGTTQPATQTTRPPATITPFSKRTPETP